MIRVLDSLGVSLREIFFVDDTIKGFNSDGSRTETPLTATTQPDQDEPIFATR